MPSSNSDSCGFRVEDGEGEGLNSKEVEPTLRCAQPSDASESRSDSDPKYLYNIVHWGVYVHICKEGRVRKLREARDRGRR